MKTAKQWQQEAAGETSIELIRRIQIDALMHAAKIAVKNQRICGRTLIRDAILAEAGKIA